MADERRGCARGDDFFVHAGQCSVCVERHGGFGGRQQHCRHGTNSATLTSSCRRSSRRFDESRRNAGDTATFVSGATGIPTPDLRWFKNARPLAARRVDAYDQQRAGVEHRHLLAGGKQRSRRGRQPHVSSPFCRRHWRRRRLRRRTGDWRVLRHAAVYHVQQRVSVVTNGRVRIYNVNDPVTPVDTGPEFE